MSINTITSNPVVLDELKLALGVSNFQISWVPIPGVNNWTSNASIGKLGNIVFIKGSMSISSASGQPEQMGTIPNGFQPSNTRLMSGTYTDGNANYFFAGLSVQGQTNLNILNSLTVGQSFTVYFDGITYSLN